MAARNKPERDGKDAIALLESDHASVQKLFKQFEKLKDQEGNDQEKAELVSLICNALKVHTQIEEEIFYPAVRKAIDDDDLMDEADVEHEGAKETISHIESMQPGEDLYDAKVTVLGEYVNHHIKEEEGQMFPKVRKSDLDTKKLGTQLLERKQDLESEMGTESASQEDTTQSEPVHERERRRSTRAAR